MAIEREFQAATAEIGVARQFVAGVVERAGVDSTTAALLTSELVANVVEHAATPFRVVVDLTDTGVRVEVHDGVAATIAFRQLLLEPSQFREPLAPRGRGLLIVAATAARFGVDETGGGGKVVWFELDRAPLPRA